MVASKSYFVYILGNQTGTLYTGFTNDLVRRISEHREKKMKGFTRKYNVARLLYFEETDNVHAALAREKEIKAWKRSKKLELVRTANPTFRDLGEDLLD